MRYRLTDARIKKEAAPDTGQRFINDTELPGFSCRITANDARSWVARGRVKGGVQRRVTIGPVARLNSTDARKRAQKVLADMSAGIDPVKSTEDKEADAIRATTLREIRTEYLATRKKKNGSPLAARTKEQYTEISDLHLAAWLDMPVASITAADVLARHKAIAKTAPGQADLTMRILRALLTYARGSLRIGDERVITEIATESLTETKKWRGVVRRKTVLTVPDMPIWWKATDKINATARNYLRLVFLTGLRKKEAMNLRWDQVDFSARLLLIRDTKNGIDLDLPMGERLRQMLHDWKADCPSDEFVFPGRKEGRPLASVAASQDELVKHGAPRVALHDLRRTFVTTAESMELSAFVIKALVNHRNQDADVTGGYVTMANERMAAAMQRVEDKLLTQAKVRTAAVIPLRSAS